MAVYVVMGVSGSGKSTVGEALADRLGCPFYDGDDFHPAENVAKMASGQPLTDDDRLPWLARLHRLIGDYLDRGEAAVIACSALKKSYRDQLRQGYDGRLWLIFLEGGFDLIWERMKGRRDHFMKAEMLHSQFEALETPESSDTLTIGIDRSVDVIVDQIMGKLMGSGSR